MKPRTSQLAQTGASSNQGLVWNGSLWLPAAIVNSFQTRTGAVTLTKADVTGTGLAASDVPFDDTGLGHVTHTNVQDAIEDLDAAVSAVGSGGGTLGTVQTYTPTWAAASVNPSLGNGTLTGRYITLDKMIILSICMVAGSTTTFGTGAWNFSLPSGITVEQIGPTASGLDQMIHSYAYDNSANLNFRASGVTDHTDNKLFPYRANGGNDPFQAVGPFTWAVNDRLLITANLFTT